MNVRVRISGDSDDMVCEGVHHVHTRASGDVVLRFDSYKKTIAADRHAGFEVSDA